MGGFACGRRFMQSTDWAPARQVFASRRVPRRRLTAQRGAAMIDAVWSMAAATGRMAGCGEDARGSPAGVRP
jgi:hypothetical protein